MIGIVDQTSLSAQARLALSQSQSNVAPAAVGDMSEIKKAAEKFSSMFLSQMFQQMFQGVGTNKVFGGGPGEEMFRSVLVDEYGKAAAKSGGFGLSDKVMQALIAQQERPS
jgi:Rod binding domain-containing protein